MRLRGINLDELIFGLVWSLVLIGMGLEVMGYYGINIVKIASTAAQQYGLILVALGVINNANHGGHNPTQENSEGDHGD